MVACAIVLLLLRPTSGLIAHQSRSVALAPSTLATDTVLAWTELTPTGDIPSVRMGSGGAWIGGQLLIYGGKPGTGTSGVMDGKVWLYDMSQNSWTEQADQNPKPQARGFSPVIWAPAEAKLLVFGGRHHFSGWTAVNDFWTYSPSDNVWEQLSPPTSPEKRFAQASDWVPETGELLVFGGDSDPGRRNDLWSYSVSQNAWTQLSPGGAGPSERQHATGNWADEFGKFLVFAGSASDGNQNDLWAYSLSDNVWAEVSPTGGLPVDRTFNTHVAAWAAAERKLLVQGGCCPRENALWAYSPSENTWTDLQPTGGTYKENHAGAWAAEEATLLIFGGWPDSNDLWSLYYRSPTPAPTPAPPTPAATSNVSPYSSPASAKGDPHLQNINGQRFDLMRSGRHVLLHIPRGADAPRILLHVVADVMRSGRQCGETYFQNINITGAWVKGKHHGNLEFHAGDVGGEKESAWLTFGPVDLKVVHGRNQGGIQYLNIYAKHLGRTQFKVGGLLGEDDHEYEATPDEDCIPRLNLYAVPLNQPAPPDTPFVSSAEASLL